MGLEETIKQFLAESAFQPNTAAAYRRGLDAFCAFFAAENDEPDLDCLDADSLVSFLRWMLSPRGRGYSERTANLYLAAVHRFLVWLDAKQQLPPAFSLSLAEHRLSVHRGRRRSNGYLRRPVDERTPQIVAYYDTLPLPIPDPGSSLATQQKLHRQRLVLLRARAIVHTLYDTAARVGEIVSLTREQVQDGYASEVLITGKGGRQRILFFSEDAQTAIRAYLAERTDQNPWLFVPHNGLSVGHITRTTVWSVVKSAARALGLNESTSPHTFRHYRATQLLNNGMPLESVQALLGHADVSTTRAVYAVTHTATLRQQLQQYGASAHEAARSLESEADEVS